MKTTKMIAVVNPKGGVSKSNSCKNLGRGLKKKVFLVLLGDTDPPASLTHLRDFYLPKLLILRRGQFFCQKIPLISMVFI
jgi:cellulose biosynthesis protein BcsQ